MTWEFESLHPHHIDGNHMREWLSGRALPCQGKCREFESRLPLHNATLHHGIGIGIPFSDIRLTAARFKTNGRSQAR